jgi:resuscitation-promoting factor RpfB
MLFRHWNLLEKPSKLTIAIAAAGIGVAAAASAAAVTLPGGATAGAATAADYLHGVGVAPARATHHSAGQLPAHEIEMARRAQQAAAVKAMRAAQARRAARAAAHRAARAEARRAARRAAQRAAALAAQHQARKARKAPSTSSAAAQPSGASLSGVWACIAQHESGGNPAANTGNGFYGAFQFTLASWQAVGGPPGLPSNYPLSVQLHYAEVLQAQSGWGNWPVSSQMCGA